MKDWKAIANKNGIKSKLFHQRITAYGWSPERAATQSIRKKRNDHEWSVIARKNGVSYSQYCYRVDEMLWSPEKAATTPTMTKKEVLSIANQAIAEYREIRADRNFKDPNNLFILTPQHFELAAKNGLKEKTVRDRVYGKGWTVQKAINTPLRIDATFEKPKEFREYEEIAKSNGIKPRTFTARIKAGWSLQEASTKKASHSNTQLRREDHEWMELAIQNGIKRNTYCGRVDQMRWSPEAAATTPPLKKGKYLNEQTEENAKNAFKKFMKKVR